MTPLPGVILTSRRPRLADTPMPRFVPLAAAGRTPVPAPTLDLNL